jgi:hypothetical protein
MQYQVTFCLFIKWVQAYVTHSHISLCFVFIYNKQQVYAVPPNKTTLLPNVSVSYIQGQENQASVEIQIRLARQTATIIHSSLPSE